jgi:glucose-6-phosphate isomerase
MIKIDLRNASASRLGETHGFELEREFEAFRNRLDTHVGELRRRAENPSDMLGWLDLPHAHDELDRIEDFVAGLDERFTDLVVLGIGGSSLGAMTVTAALQHPWRNLQDVGTGLRVHYVDNVDPDVVAGLMDVLEPGNTLVNVISKSGTTAETMSAYLAFKRWLKDGVGPDYRKQIIATTDPETGILRPLAEAERYTRFSVPPSVGGRFSVFSAVGLVPIALAGIDIRALLRGAARANEAIGEPLENNPALQATLVQYLAYRRDKRISVLMPYSTPLRYPSNWFVQLWAESLGKAVDRRDSRVHAGSTPVAAIGTTDQHSQVQLFNEGPQDKIVAFVRIGDFDREVEIPDSEPDVDELAYLAGKTFNQLIDAEQAATAHALAEHRRPNYTLAIEELSADSLGELMQLLMWQTAVMGELLEIDTYNQPGVELGKRYTYALMGRDGYDELRQELADAGID